MSWLSAVATGAMGLLNSYENRRAAKKQYDYQMAMWNANNAYNTPAQQMERLREAGLNPNLVYGGGSATHTATMASAPKVNPTNYDLNSGMDTILKYQQADIFNQELLNLKETQELIKSQIAQNKANTKSTTISNKRSAHDLEVYRNTGIDPAKSGTGAQIGSVVGNVANKIRGAGQAIGNYVGDKLYQILH